MGKKNKDKKKKKEKEIQLVELLDPDDIMDPEKMKREHGLAVHDMIMSGASAQDLVEAFNYKHLQDALAYFNVRGRSSLTYMKDMANELISVLDDELSKQRAGTKNDTEFKKMQNKVGSIEEELFQEKHAHAKLKREYEELERKYKKLKKKSNKKYHGKNY